MELSTLLSIRPAAISSSEFGKSSRLFKLKWLKKESVVPYARGFPGISFLPAGLTQPNSNKTSIVPVEKDTPLISSISDLVTG